MRETRSGTSAAAYLVGKILSHIPYVIVSPLMYVIFFYYTAYPPMSASSLYLILLCATLVTTAIGVLVSLVVSDKSSQVTCMIFCLICVLFNGTQSGMPANVPLSTDPFGWCMMHLSFARYAVGALFIATVRSQPPALMQKLIHDMLHNNGYSEVEWQVDTENLPTQVRRCGSALLLGARARAQVLVLARA